MKISLSPAYFFWLLMAGFTALACHADTDHQSVVTDTQQNTATHQLTLFTAPEHTPDNPLISILYPMLEKAYQQQGIDIKWVHLPVKRGLRAVKSGDVDGFPITPHLSGSDRDDLILIDQPLFSVTMLLHVHQSQACPTAEQLPHLKPAKVMGMKYFDQLLEPGGQPALVVQHFKSLPEILKTQRADYTYLNQQGNLSNARRDLKACADLPSKTVYFYSYLNKKHQALQIPLQKAYKDMFGPYLEPERMAVQEK